MKSLQSRFHGFKVENPSLENLETSSVKVLRLKTLKVENLETSSVKTFDLRTLCRLAILPGSLKPVLNWANVCSPNILRTLRRTMIRFLTELLVRRIRFGQSKLYFVLNWLVMKCKLRPQLAADAQQTA